MFRNSLNPSSTTSSSPFGASGGGSDEYYEFDGARLEIKHNASIRQSGVTIEPPKISNSINNESSILEGSDSILSPISAENNNYLDTRMSEPQQATNNSAPGRRMCGVFDPIRGLLSTGWKKVEKLNLLEGGVKSTSDSFSDIGS